MNSEHASIVQRLARYDHERPSLPGEHWLTFGFGLYLLVRRRRTTVARLASLAAGTLLVSRALAGRDGALAALRRYVDRTADEGFVEVAAPWPYDERVRVSRRHRTSRGASAVHALGARETVSTSP